jgi:transposase
MCSATATGIPSHVHVTAGQTHENQALTTLLEGVDVCDQDEVPIVYPAKLAGDKGYRANWIDDYLLGLNIQPVIPSKQNEDRADRPVEFDREAYRQRNAIERLIGWLKESRRVLTRFEKTAKNFLGMIKMAFIQRYLRLLCA